MTSNGAGHPGCVTVALVSRCPGLGASALGGCTSHSCHRVPGLELSCETNAGSEPQRVGACDTPAEVCVGGSGWDRQVLTCAWEGGTGPSVTPGQAGQDTLSPSDSWVALRQPTAWGLWVPTQVGVAPPRTSPMSSP